VAAVCIFIYVVVTAAMLLVARYYESTWWGLDYYNVDFREYIFFSRVVAYVAVSAILDYIRTGNANYKYYAVFITAVFVAATVAGILSKRYPNNVHVRSFMRYFLYVVAVLFVPFIVRAACPS
jgi:hypothetical protein